MIDMTRCRAPIRRREYSGPMASSPAAPDAATRQDEPAPSMLRRLVALTTAHLLSDGAGNFLPGVLPAVLVVLGQPVSMAGALVAALSIGQVLQPLVGWVADRVGGRILPPLGLLLTSVGGGLVGVAPTTGVLIALLLAIGVGSSLFHPPSLASIRRMAGPRTGLAISVFLVGGELGRGLWPTIASLITTHLGLSWLWLIAIPGLIWLPMLYHWMPRLPAGSTDRAPIRWRRHAFPASLLIGFRCLQAFTVFSLSAFIPILWHLRGESLVAGAAVITTVITVGVAGNLFGGFLADRVGRRPVLLASAVGAAALVVPVAHVSGWWVFPIAAALGISLFLPAASAILIGQDIFPENRSMGSGIALGLANGLAAIAVLVVGLFVTETNVLVVFWALAALALVCVLIAAAFPAGLMRREAS